jgi:Tfp pilus assembly protein PilF
MILASLLLIELTNRAGELLKAGRASEARQALQQARQQPGWQHDRPFTFELHEAEMFRQCGDGKRAESALRLAIARPDLPSNLYAVAINNLAAHLFARKQIRQAGALFETALRKMETAEMLNNLGTVRHRQHRYVEAEALYLHSLALNEMPQTLANLAHLYADRKQDDDALACFSRMTQRLAELLPNEERNAARHLDRYEYLLRKRAEPAEAERISSISMRLRIRHAIRAN